VASRDRGLQRIWAERSAEPFCALEGREAATDQEPVPPRTVLVQALCQGAANPSESGVMAGL